MECTIEAKVKARSSYFHIICSNNAGKSFADRIKRSRNNASDPGPAKAEPRKNKTTDTAFVEICFASVASDCSA